MRWRTEYPVLLNLLVALAVSLVVNFSYLLLLFLEWLLPGIWPTVNKAAGDIILAICSYQIQMHWVFREEKAHGAG